MTGEDKARRALVVRPRDDVVGDAIDKKAVDPAQFVLDHIGDRFLVATRRRNVDKPHEARKEIAHVISIRSKRRASAGSR